MPLKMKQIHQFNKFLPHRPAHLTTPIQKPHHGYHHRTAEKSGVFSVSSSTACHGFIYIPNLWRQINSGIVNGFCTKNSHVPRLLNQSISFGNFKMHLTCRQLLTGGTVSQFSSSLVFNKRFFFSHSSAHVSSTDKQAVSSAKWNSSFVEVSLRGHTCRIPNIWLRDHCRSNKLYNHKTHQKILDLELSSQDWTPSAVSYSEDMTVISIQWKDGHVSHFKLEWLADNYFPGVFSRHAQRVYWNHKMIQSEGLPTVTYTEHMETDGGLTQSLRNLVKYGITVVKGVPASVAATQAVVERVAYVQETLFGKMWLFTADGSRSDTAFTTQSLGAHTDNTYMHTPAGLQVFQCLEHSGSGGETLLVDGFHALQTLQRADSSAFDVLTKTVVPHEYKEDAGDKSPGYHLYNLGTVVTVHPVSGELIQLRFNPYDRAPLNTVRPDDIPAFYEAYEKLSRIISNKDNEVWVKLKPGSVLFIDNWRVMHGRAAFDGNRVMCGCYLPREEWISLARMKGLM
ncbi:unnamed protein product [Lymnaea stagnalis]|uniref:Trimethyllysine dioxygenase, mitochondrial n=1 Tax=Lymnaea stagnalis TaxID=6523 RepID=A0AAV2I897_LYMST